MSISWGEFESGGWELQCHLDINGVVLGQETIEGRTSPSSEYAAVMLAYGTYFPWVAGREETSYKTYVWEHLHPGENSDPLLRKVRKEALRQFVTELSLQKHPLAERVQDQYQKLIAVLESSPVFPGFSLLLRRLREEMVPHHLIFRTFGGDGEVVKSYLAKEYPDLRLRVGRMDLECLFRYQDGDREVVISDPAEMRKTLLKGHWLIQDSFDRWRRGNECGSSGKLFPLSLDEKDRVLSLFADDNLEIVPTPEERTIVCCYDVSSRRSISTLEALSYLIKVNPIDAALNPNYLINRVEAAVQRVLSSKAPHPVE